MRIATILRAVALATALAGLWPAGARANMDFSTPEPGDPHASVQQAIEMLDRRDVADALLLLKQLLADPSFAELSEPEQHFVLNALGFAELNTGDSAGALASLRRASRMEQATVQDWQWLVLAAGEQRDGRDAAEAVTTLARRWPDALNQLRPQLVSYALQLITPLPDAKPLRFQLLSALYDAHWPKGRFVDGSYLWRDLSLDLLQAGDTDKAMKVATAVKVPLAVASMRVDFRFDPIVQRNPSAFDPQKAMDDYIGQLRARVAARPNSLETMNALIGQLLIAGRDAEALKLLEQTLPKALPHAGSQPAYADAAAQVRWTLDDRASALANVGRFDEAVAAMRSAAQDPEYGRPNFSQAVNLAELLNRLGRPKEALQTVAPLKVGSGSPYGDLAAESERAWAYAQLGETDKLARSIAFARAHLREAPGVLQAMLFYANDLDGAAALFVQRLNDPTMRGPALMALQRWLDGGTQTPIDHEMNRRFEAVRSRPEVQAAVKAVGRIETFPFRQS